MPEPLDRPKVTRDETIGSRVRETLSVIANPPGGRTTLVIIVLIAGAIALAAFAHLILRKK